MSDPVAAPGFDILLAACLLYATLLFAVAFAAERLSVVGRGRWLRGPAVYTLSLSVYCTAWTFYGAVGYAARSGLEFATIYLGPTLILVGWWGILRKMVRVGRRERITSVADMISSRYGKSPFLGGLVTLIAVLGTTPYIALQLQSVTLSFAVFAGEAADDVNLIAFVVAVGLAIFTIVFGTRRLDSSERHPGIVTAIALEGMVKLVALVSVGVFVVWGLGGGPAAVFATIEASPLAEWRLDAGRWGGLIFLSSAAFLCLPRMFQVLVVENDDDGQLAVASWAFPLYLMAMSLFVVPIAAIGLWRMPEGSNPDLFVLTLPLSEGRIGLAMLSFLGGFSSATSMVIVAAVALSTMVSNHLVMPIWLSSAGGRATMSGDVRQTVILSRRLAIVGVLGLGYLYFRLSGGGAALAAIGLVSFAGIAQTLPALLGGLYWRGATRIGAAAGLIAGFAVWVWTLFLPSAGGGLPSAMMLEGPFGLGWARPQALFGIEGIDPVLHALLWSMIANLSAFVGVSLTIGPGPMERLQGARYVNVFRRAGGARAPVADDVPTEDLLLMAQRILGAAEAQAVFEAEAHRQGVAGHLPRATEAFVHRLERELAGSVGAATAHAMMAQITRSGEVSVDEMMRVADESQQIIEASARLETQSRELALTAQALQSANDKLTQLSVQKDAFLGQVSHELRTPMTSIRAFSEILREGAGEGDEARRFASIIHAESTRLTRLLDDLLDLGLMQGGQVKLALTRITVGEVIDRALSASGGLGRIGIVRLGRSSQVITTDPDRLSQVFINLIANAAKYCDSDDPSLSITVTEGDGHVIVDFADNGSGVPAGDRSVIFEKFYRAGDDRRAGGAGLGLAICKEIMGRVGGSIAYVAGTGATFRVTLPMAKSTDR